MMSDKNSPNVHVVKVDLSRCRPGDLKLEVENDVDLVVSLKRKSDGITVMNKWSLMRYHDPDGISAVYDKDGMLTVSMKKLPPPPPSQQKKRIKVIEK